MALLLQPSDAASLTPGKSGRGCGCSGHLHPLPLGMRIGDCVAGGLSEFC